MRKIMDIFFASIIRLRIKALLLKVRSKRNRNDAQIELSRQGPPEIDSRIKLLLKGHEGTFKRFVTLVDEHDRWKQVNANVSFEDCCYV